MLKKITEWFNSLFNKKNVKRSEIAAIKNPKGEPPKEKFPG
jgi:hypothetical protein